MLAAVVTAIRGVSARARLEALMAGERDVMVLADCARGRRRAQRDQGEEALPGDGTPPHSFLLTESLSQRDALAEAIARVRATIARLDTRPGVRQRTAESLLAAIGTARARFPSATPLASWAGIGPGHDDSGGKRLSGKPPQGRRWRRQGLVAAAHVAAKTPQTDLAAQDRRLAARRGKTRALMALGHTLLIRVSHVLTRTQPAQDGGAASCDTRDHRRIEHRLGRRVERLGDHVS